MERGRGCECVMHELASLQPIHTQNDTLAVVASRGSPASKPPYSDKRRRWEGLEGKGNGDVARVKGEAGQGCSHASAWEKSGNPRCQKRKGGGLREAEREGAKAQAIAR